MKLKVHIGAPHFVGDPQVPSRQGHAPGFGESTASQTAMETPFLRKQTHQFLEIRQSARQVSREVSLLCANAQLLDPPVLLRL